MWAEQIRTAGAVRDAYRDAANAPIDLDDIAAVATTSLLEEGHTGRAYELTGPETITRGERVRLIGTALGRDIPFVELTHDRRSGNCPGSWASMRGGTSTGWPHTPRPRSVRS